MIVDIGDGREEFVSEGDSVCIRFKDADREEYKLHVTPEKRSIEIKLEYPDGDVLSLESITTKDGGA